MFKNHEFSVVSSEYLVESPILGLRRDTVVMPGGTQASREVVEHFGAVAVAAVDEEGRVAMVRQYRHSVGQRLLELPAGLLDIAGEDPLEAAQRELVEEAGLAAASWTVLTDVMNSPGYCDEACRIFLATGLRSVERPESEDDEEADMSNQWVSLAEARAQILRSEIMNSIAVAGIFAASEVLAGRGSGRPADCPFPARPMRLAQRREAAGIAPDMKRLPSQP
ncbi:NUDIX domain-containing protein [Corynebacterium tapiri]|uniref:NUDIX hydrolase n=1 Tax=Corynebacterium tapiri TaxID=1448266 RepID=A0A5C4U3K5_9CORY|nr:NUDIX hydrolase [Corynebacterium tapiri]TNL97658.1 NUDIX hydrolase [Corynebacterium tapiri]